MGTFLKAIFVSFYEKNRPGTRPYANRARPCVLSMPNYVKAGTGVRKTCMIVPASVHFPSSGAWVDTGVQKTCTTMSVLKFSTLNLLN